MQDTSLTEDGEDAVRGSGSKTEMAQGPLVPSTEKKKGREKGREGELLPLLTRKEADQVDQVVPSQEVRERERERLRHESDIAQYGSQKVPLG
jgi:hypothetical protein